MVIVAAVALQGYRIQLEREPAPEHVVAENCGGIEQVRELNIHGESAMARCNDWRMMIVANVDIRGIYGN